MHIDDLRVLEHIQQTLGIGKIYTKPGEASLVVQRLEDIKIILGIFTKTPLNSNKQLNFLAFNKAFEFYTQTKDRRDPLFIEQMEAIRASMNNNRTDFEQADRKFNITPNWLLGFIEGDGSFSVNRLKTQSKYQIVFSISQSATDLALLTAIKIYLNKLAETKGIVLPLKSSAKYLEGTQDRDFVNLSSSSNKSILKPNKKYNLIVRDFHYLKDILIPYLDTLVFRAKKGLDYIDWKNILLLIEKGFHYTEEGEELIELTLKQMNNQRLTTNTLDNTLINRDLLLNKIINLLSKPSNFELKEDGKIFIKSLNRYYYNNTIPQSILMLDDTGSVVKSWASLTSCADNLGMSKSGVQKRLKNKTLFLFDGKTVYLDKIITKNN